MTVLLCPIENSKVCAYMRVINAGSKDEDACVPTGAAHFIEHMSFRIQNGKIWSLASKGDVINAETNMDSTRFYVIHLPHQTKETIQIDAERFSTNAVPKDKVSVERNAVMNELERGERASNKMFRMTSSVAILQHPYHHDTIGTRFDVNSTQAEDMEYFRKKYYVPNNTTLIFCGAVDCENTLNHVDEHFGHIPPTPLKIQHTPEPEQQGKRMSQLNIPAPCPMICLGFRQPKGSTKESIVLQCISRLLWHNSAGYAQTLIQNNILHDVSTYSPRQLNPYIWFFHGTLNKYNNPQTNQQNLMTAEKHMLQVLNNFVSHKIPVHELDILKSSIQDNWNKIESATDMMNELGRGASIGNWKDIHDRKIVLETIVPEDIQKVAQAVFREQNLTTTFVNPTNTPQQKYTPTDIACSKLTLSPKIPLKLTSSQKDWSTETAQSTTNVHCPRASYPRITLTARFSPAFYDQASLLVSVLKNQDTTIPHTTCTFYNDHEFIHMAIDLPQNNSILQSSVQSMFQHRWLTPSLKQVDLQKRLMSAELNSLHTNTDFQLKKHFITSLFEKTIYNVPISVRANRIAAHNYNDMKRFHEKWINRENTIVTMVTSTPQIASIIQAEVSGSVGENATLEWKALPRQQKNIRLKFPNLSSFKVLMGQTVQLKPNSLDHIALRCAVEILGGGMTGRLMHVVREQRGLGTYGIYANLQVISAKTPSIFSIKATFSPNSIDEGLQCAEDILKQWQENGVTASELENAKDRMLGRRIIAADSIDELHDMLLPHVLEGKPPEQEFFEFNSKIKSLTLEHVNKIIKTHINHNQLVHIVIEPEK